MNIFMYEVKSQFRSFLVWTTAIVLTMMLYMQGVYPIFKDSAYDVVQMMDGLPKEFLQVFGFDIESMFSFGGFYGFVFTYVALVGAIMSVIVALSVFAREKRLKCMDFILSKPISRKKIFSWKALVCVAIITVTNIIFMMASIAMYFANEQEGESIGRFVMASLCLYFTQIIFLAIGIFLAIFTKKIRSVSGLATSIGFAGFIMTALSNIIDEKITDFLALFRYFDPGMVMKNGNFELKYIVTASFIVLICMVSSYIKFCKSDVHAV